MKNVYLIIAVVLFTINVTFAQAPANDSCANAIEVFFGAGQAFSTIGADTDGPLHVDAPCASSDPDSIYNDIWYYYTSTINGMVKWSMCGTADFDSKIAVYNAGATCPLQDGDLLDCNEDGSGCALFTSEITFDVLMGSTYYLRLGGYGEVPPGEEGSGTFSLQEFVPPPGPPNNECSNAEVIGLVEGFQFTTIGATTDGPDHPGNTTCFGFGDVTAQSDIWYLFTPDFTGTVEWSTCDMISFDSRLVVYGPNVSCPPSADDLYDCNDDGGGCGDYTSLLIFEVVADDTYLLRMGGFDGEVGIGTFYLREITPPTPPANDLCMNSDSVFIMTATEADDFTYIFEGNTENGTFDMDNFIYPPCLTNQTGGEFSDVWYHFNTGNNSELEIRASSLTIGGAFFIDFLNDCMTEVDTNIVLNSCHIIDDGTVTIEEIVTGLTPNTDMIVRVTTRLTSDLPGEFFFQLVGETSTSINEFEIPASFSVFPNPVTGEMQIPVLMEEAHEASLEIIDAVGRKVIQRDLGLLTAGNHTERLDVSNLDPGLYLITFKVGGGLMTRKFVKQ